MSKLLLWALGSVALLAGCGRHIVEAQNSTNGMAEQAVSGCGPRVRKPWDALTPIEKQLYLTAVARTMDDGLYLRFVEIHTETLTTNEAHRTCMFLYWHRIFLLGFENLLRSYGGEFACITIPYWNYVDENAHFMQGDCPSMEGCSAFLQESGGSTRGINRQVLINGSPSSGTCVSTPPLNHFCEIPSASTLTTPSCAQCVPRGDWLTGVYPPTASISSLMRQLFVGSSIQDVASNIEQGIHNTIHNSLGGVMGQLEAPADPIFWSHHATLDLLQSIYRKCTIGDGQPETLQQTMMDPRMMVNCPRRRPVPAAPNANPLVITGDTEVEMNSGPQGSMPLSVRDPRNPLSLVYAALPNEYVEVADTRNLGVNSYTYEVTGLLAQLFVNCVNLGLPLGRQLTEESEVNGLKMVVQLEEADDKSWFPQVYQVALDAMQGNVSQALVEVEKMTCMFYEQCRGKVVDFSRSFRQHFNASGSTPCRRIIDGIAQGHDSIRVPNWSQVMSQQLTCNKTI